MVKAGLFYLCVLLLAFQVSISIFSTAMKFLKSIKTTRNHCGSSLLLQIVEGHSEKCEDNEGGEKTRKFSCRLLRCACSREMTIKF
jgi:hypothetical protein